MRRLQLADAVHIDGDLLALGRADLAVEQIDLADEVRNEAGLRDS